jgi:hypothetical protein
VEAKQTLSNMTGLKPHKRFQMVLKNSQNRIQFQKVYCSGPKQITKLVTFQNGIAKLVCKDQKESAEELID